jgi:hypothetical protein
MFDSLLPRLSSGALLVALLSATEPAAAQAAPSAPAAPTTRPRNKDLAEGGIGMMIVGAVAVVVGAVIVHDSVGAHCGSLACAQVTPDHEDEVTGGTVTIVGGGVLILAGVTLFFIGRSAVPVVPPATARGLGFTF